MIGGVAIAVFGSWITVRRWGTPLKEVRGCAREFAVGVNNEARLQTIFEMMDNAEQKPSGIAGWYGRNKKALMGVLATLAVFAVTMVAEIIIVNQIAKPYEQALDGRTFTLRYYASWNEWMEVYTLSFSNGQVVGGRVVYDVPTGEIAVVDPPSRSGYRVRFELFSGRPILGGTGALILDSDGQIIGLEPPSYYACYSANYVEEEARVAADPATLTKQGVTEQLADRLAQYGRENDITVRGDASVIDGVLTQCYTFMADGVTCYVGTQNGKVVRVISTVSANGDGEFNVVGVMMPASVCYGGDPIELKRDILANGVDYSDEDTFILEWSDGGWTYTCLKSSDSYYVMALAE